jgi:DNA polymerase-1
MSEPNLQNIPIRTDEGRRIRLAFVAGDPKKNVPAGGRLQPDRAADPGPPVAGAGPAAGVRGRRGRPPGGGGRGVQRPDADVSREQRGYAKTINFGIVYGVSAFGLARRIEGLSIKAAQELIDSYNKRFPKIQEFLKTCVAHAQQHGYVQTMLGRRRPVPEISSGVMHMRSAAERVAINSVVQGSAADLIKIAMVNVYRRLRADNRPSRMLLQVHDELVFETPEHRSRPRPRWSRRR